MSKKTIRTIAALAAEALITPESVISLQEAAKTLPIAITPQLASLINKNDPNDPIARQFVPQVHELSVQANESADPIGDNLYTAVRGIVHRYPDRCLFTPVHICPVYCRFCFRREKIAAKDQSLTEEEVATAFNYIRHHPEIWEVILTGGDPLILKPQVLKKYITALAEIKHVTVIRIHTRVPIVDSLRITDDMMAALKTHKPMFIVIHANHANEFTPEASNACAKLVNAGIPLLSQTLLLQGINDNIEALSELMRYFIKNRIKPYYLHHGDLVKGTAHFRTSIATGQALMKQLRGRFSGICQPTYVLDIPGGYGKVPIGPHYIEPINSQGEAMYCVEDYLGHFHHYPPT